MPESWTLKFLTLNTLWRDNELKIVHIAYCKFHIKNFELTVWMYIQNIQYENFVSFVFTPTK